MKLRDVGLPHARQLLKPHVTSATERPTRGCCELRKIVAVLVPHDVPSVAHPTPIPRTVRLCFETQQRARCVGSVARARRARPCGQLRARATTLGPAQEYAG